MEEVTKTERPTVMSVGAKYGLIIGLVSIAYSIIFIAVGINPYDGGWKGWVGTVISIVLIVLAHKNFKDTGDGFMTYGQGFGISFVAVLVSMFLSGVFMFVYMQFIDPALFDQIWEKTAADMEAKGQSDEQIEMALSWGRKLFWPSFAIMGVIFGALIGLIVSIFAQKKAPEQAF